jgi:outer membrane protein TolC
VAEAYWKLYRARAEFFQRQKLLAAAQQVRTTLEGRNQVDTIPRQILRARAALARAESRMQRAVTDIRNAESQLRLLVNDPAMLNSGPIELTPSEAPAAMPSPAGLRDSLQTALVNRPDISRAIREMRASSVRIGVSKSELLPKLDFIVSSYVAGLESRTQIADSIGNQFTDGRPGYTVGLEFEVPVGNRAARARLEQRQWELKRSISAFRVTVETAMTEVEIASREVDTAYREMLGRYQAMLAAENEVSYLQDRFEVLPIVEDSSILLLEDLLGGYERLADEESALVVAQTNYALSIIQLRQATGTLLRSRHDAPALEAEESEWMSSRADQALSDDDSLVIPAVDRLSTEAAPGTKAGWFERVTSRTGGNEKPNGSDIVPSSAVDHVGGHSFGRNK